MALLYVKSQLFGDGSSSSSRRRKQQDDHRYSPLAYSDVERASNSSLDAHIHEKAYDVPSQDQPQRVDGRIVSDATIGLSDGLTVPFALTAGLSALGSSRVVIIAGLAELIAGSISMGLGGYLGAKSEAEGYETTLTESRDLARRAPAQASAVVQESLAEWELPPELHAALVEHLRASSERTTNYLMRFHHCMQEQAFEPRRAYISALTIAMGYFLGGFTPLIPYFFVARVSDALAVSVMVMLVALFAFGYAKTRLVGQRSTFKCAVAGVQMVLLGGLAAAAAVACVRVASMFGGGEDGGAG